MALDFVIDPDIAKASTPPSHFYTDSSLYKQSINAVFARSWQYVMDEESLKIPSYTFPFTLLEGCLDEPLLFTRDNDDKIHLVSNVCTHRGNIVCEGPGNDRFLRCRYHGRRFRLDGKFESMPEFEGVEGFPSELDSLKKVEFGGYARYLFASLNPRHALSEVIRPMQERLAWLPLNEFVFRPERSREYMVRGHWALYVDNYLEGFHIPFIHADLNAVLDYGNYLIELLPQGVLQLAYGKSGDDTFDLPTSSPDYGKSIVAYYYWLFPNTMFNFYPWGLSINVVRPLAPDLTKVSFYCYVWKDDRLDRGAGGALDRVEREDEAVVELVQKGLRSRIYNRGRYSVARENGTHHFHRLLTASFD